MRSPDLLTRVVTTVDPYVYSDVDTGADRFVRAVLAALGVYLPEHRRVGELLETDGFSAGWEALDAEEAELRARQGYPVVAVGPAPDRHPALVVPSRAGEGVWISQGGLAPRHRAPLAAGYGMSRPTFWEHY